MSKVADELRAEFNSLVAKVHALFDKLHGDETQLAHDAEADAKPVVEKVKEDGVDLEHEAAADVHDLTQPSTPPASPEPPTAA